MALSTAHDIPLLIIVPSDPSTPTSTPLVSAERRITPSWTIAQLKSKLEPVTGIPAGDQIFKVKSLDGSWLTLSPDSALVSSFNLAKGNEIAVIDTRPAGARQNFNDVSSVEKYVMPGSEYEKLEDTVLAWKKRQGLGRFDPNAKSLEQLTAERRQHDENEVETKGIKVGMRCRVGESDERRGVVKYIGDIEGLGGDREKGCIWVGVEFDEPVGRNDGSVEVETVKEDGKKGRETKRVFQAKGNNYGAFARPEKVEVGEQFGVLDDLMDEDMEEI